MTDGHGKFSAVARETVNDEPSSPAPRDAARALVTGAARGMTAVCERASAQFAEAAVVEIRALGARLGVDFEPEIAKFEALRKAQRDVFDAALVVGLYWGQQAGAPMAAAEDLTAAVKAWVDLAKPTSGEPPPQAKKP